MKLISKWILLLLLFIGSISGVTPVLQAENTVVIHFFYSETCSHCHAEGLVLDELEILHPNLVVHRYEVNSGNMELFNEVMTAFSNAPYDYALSENSVPLTIVGGFAFSGYNDQRRNDIESLISRYENTAYVDVVQKMIDGIPILNTDFDDFLFETGDLITLPLIGTLKIEEVSLGLAAVVIGIVDGFNPCAMWILIFLITLLANQKNRKRMWILGSTFLVTSALVYFLVMVAWLQIAVSLAQVNWIRIILGITAMIFGGFQLYRFWKTRHQEVGCEVTDETQHKKMISKVKAVVEKKNLWIALLGIVALAFSVNIVELACSAGLPVLYTQILAYNQLSTGTSVLFILLYILFFLLDDLIVFALAMITLRVTGITSKYARLSHLIGGIVMVVLGFLMIFFPSIIQFNF